MCTRWEDDIAKGKANSANKLKEQVTALDDMVSKITARKLEVQQAHAKADAAWEGFNQQRREQWKAVLAQLDAKIAANEALPQQEAAAAGSQAPLALPSPPQGSAPSHNEALERAQQETAATREALAKAQEAHKQAVQAKEATERAAAAMDTSGTPQLATFECDTADLPSSLAEPAAEDWQHYHQLYIALDILYKLEASGTVIPVTYGQMRCGLQVPRTLLGEKLWAQAYPNIQPTEDTVVTRQLWQLLSLSLRFHHAKLVTDKANFEAAIAAAADSVNAAATEHRNKRKRAMDPGPGQLAAC